MEQHEEFLTDQQREASTKAASSHGAESDCESKSSDSGDSEAASDKFGHLKVMAAAALAGISYNFGLSNIKKTHVGSMESYTHYFPEGYGQPPSAEFVPEPRANDAIIFEDFFTAELRMPPLSVIVDILRKFWVQLHHLTLNAIIQIGKFIWAITSYGGHPTAVVFA
jgi:hypothetical protein